MRMRNLQQRILYIFLLAAACGALQAQPFGYIDCPVTGTSGLCAGNPTPSLTGVISVSGWALSSNIVYKVAITRDAVAGETGSSVFLVNATLVPGSRPDVASAYPDIREIPLDGEHRFSRTPCRILTVLAPPAKAPIHFMLLLMTMRGPGLSLVAQSLWSTTPLLSCPSGRLTNPHRAAALS